MYQATRRFIVPSLTNYKGVIKSLIHFICALWLGSTFYDAAIDNLGADPVEALLHFTGMGAFNLVLLSMAMSPAAKQLRAPVFIQYRRMLGLWAAFYALVHFTVFVLFELQLQWSLLLEEIVKRPYITVGFAALLILIALMLTSTKSIQRKMGARWQALHNWIYLGVSLIALHFLWSVKSLDPEPIIYFLIVAVFLYARKDKLLKPFRQRKKRVS